MDVPEAPAIVIQRPVPCADALSAQDLLKRTLAPALAPRAAWSVVTRFSRKGASMTVEGKVTDEVDRPVAHRVLTETGYECASLARAVGIWAALVLDAEVERASRAPPPLPSPPAPPPPEPSLPAVEDPPVEKSPPDEASILLGHDEGERTIEFGLSMFLMGGTGSGVMLGPAAFAVAEAARGWFLRPAVFFGETLDGVGVSSDVNGTLIAGRFDACGRIPGFYIEHHGIQLDVCAGVEGGNLHVDAVTSSNFHVSDELLFMAAGPSATLRGELGGGLAIMIRGVMDYNVVRPTIGGTDFDPSVLVGRAEVGLSWQLR